MRCSGRRLWIAQVWLAALMLPVAGLPHFYCLCPDGHVKPFCLSSPSEESGCCCGGSCCGSVPAEGLDCKAAPSANPGEKTQCCCCQAHAEKATRQPVSDAGHQLNGLACHKTLTQTD